MKKFRIRNDGGVEGGDSNRRKRKANRHTVKRSLFRLTGLIETESDSDRRQVVSAKASLYGMAMEQKKQQARLKNLQPVSVTVSDDDDYDWRLIDEAMPDSYGDPYSFESPLGDGPEPEFEEPGYFADWPNDYWTKPRNKYLYLLPDMPELPIDKGNGHKPDVDDLISWLDRQVGRRYQDIYADAKLAAGKHWWMVRKLLRELCTTNGKSAASDDFESKTEVKRFSVDVEGMLRHNLPPKKRYERPVIIDKQVETWLDGRQIVVRGAHLFWYVCTTPGKFHGCYRQDRELNNAEMNFFAQLDYSTQADLLQRFKSVEQMKQLVLEAKAMIESELRKQ